MGLKIKVGCVIQHILKAGCRINIEGQNCNNFHFVARNWDEKIIILFGMARPGTFVYFGSLNKAYFEHLSGELKTQVRWNTGCCDI